MNFQQGGFFVACIVIAFALKASASSLSTLATKDCKCNYGGKCDEDGFCLCPFNCNPLVWPTTIYCGPKIGGHRKYYLNLCQLLAHACERQEDIPLVKYNMKKKSCEDEIPPAEKLCNAPQDYMGPCGGTLSLYGNIGAGICLSTVQSGLKRCRCPTDRIGSDCQTIKLYDVKIKGSYQEEEASEAGFTQTKIIMFSAGVLLVVVILVLLLLKREKSRSKKPSTSSKRKLLRSIEDAVLVEIEPAGMRVDDELKSSSDDKAKSKKVKKQTADASLSKHLQIVTAIEKSKPKSDSMPASHSALSIDNFNSKEGLLDKANNNTKNISPKFSKTNKKT